MPCRWVVAPNLRQTGLAAADRFCRRGCCLVTIYCTVPLSRQCRLARTMNALLYFVVLVVDDHNTDDLHVHYLVPTTNWLFFFLLWVFYKCFPSHCRNNMLLTSILISLLCSWNWKHYSQGIQCWQLGMSHSFYCKIILKDICLLSSRMPLMVVIRLCFTYCYVLLFNSHQSEIHYSHTQLGELSVYAVRSVRWLRKDVAVSGAGLWQSAWIVHSAQRSLSSEADFSPRVKISKS